MKKLTVSIIIAILLGCTASAYGGSPLRIFKVLKKTYPSRLVYTKSPYLGKLPLYFGEKSLNKILAQYPKGNMRHSFDKIIIEHPEIGMILTLDIINRGLNSKGIIVDKPDRGFLLELKKEILSSGSDVKLLYNSTNANIISMFIQRSIDIVSITTASSCANDYKVNENEVNEDEGEKYPIGAC